MYHTKTLSILNCYACEPRAFIFSVTGKPRALWSR